MRWIYLLILAKILAIAFSGCTTYEGDFLVDCERINAETVRCDVMGVPYLADFPIKEEYIQMRARVQYCEGNKHGSLYIFYGGNWERKDLHKDDALALYDKVKEDPEMNISKARHSPAPEHTEQDLIDRLVEIREGRASTSTTTTAKKNDWRAIP